MAARLMTPEQEKFLADMANDYDGKGEGQAVAVEKYVRRWLPVDMTMDQNGTCSDPVAPTTEQRLAYNDRVLAAYKRQRRKVNQALRAAHRRPGDGAPGAQVEPASEEAKGVDEPARAAATAPYATALPSACTPLPATGAQPTRAFEANYEYGNGRPGGVRVVREPLVPERPLTPSSHRAAQTLVGLGPVTGITPPIATPPKLVDIYNSPAITPSDQPPGTHAVPLAAGNAGPLVDERWTICGVGDPPVLVPGTTLALDVLPGTGGSAADVRVRPACLDPLTFTVQHLEVGTPSEMPPVLTAALTRLTERVAALADGFVSPGHLAAGYADALAAKDGEIETLKKYVAYLERQVGAR